MDCPDATVWYSTHSRLESWSTGLHKNQCLKVDLQVHDWLILIIILAKIDTATKDINSKHQSFSNTTSHTPSTYSEQSNSHSTQAAADALSSALAEPRSELKALRVELGEFEECRLCGLVSQAGIFFNLRKLWSVWTRGSSMSPLASHSLWHDSCHDCNGQFYDTRDMKPTPIHVANASQKVWQAGGLSDSAWLSRWKPHLVSLFHV